MVHGMPDGEPRKLGGEGVGVCPKHSVPRVLTPVMGESGVMEIEYSFNSIQKRPRRRGPEECSVLIQAGSVYTMALFYFYFTEEC